MLKTDNISRKVTDWQQILSLFTPTVQSDFLGLLRPLSSLFKPMHTESNEGPMEPDGLDGIANKGRYQDLLLSEWALLDEIPDEFERRFVMSEHLFLRKKKTEQNRQKLCIVLFDVGSNQFGSAKLGQLLLLILMYRRAMQAGAEFRFGALQSSLWINDGELDQAAILKLIDTRHPGLVDEHHAGCWNEQLQQFDDHNREVWTVSDRILPQISSATGSVVIKELAFSPEPTLKFEVKLQTSKSLKLKLPDAATQIRMLRHPFEAPAKAKPGLDSMSPCAVLGFAGNGRRIMMLDENNTLHIHQIPKQLNRQTKTLPPVNIGEQVMAISHNRNNIVRLNKAVKCYRLTEQTGRSPVRFGHNQDLTINPAQIFESMLYIANKNSERCLFVLDSQRNLIKLLPDEPVRRLETVDENLAKLGRVSSISYCVRYDPTHLTINTFIERENSPSHEFSYGGYPYPPVLVHPTGAWKFRCMGCFAYQLSTTHWALIHNNNQTECPIPEDCTAFGVYIEGDNPGTIKLLCLSADKRQVLKCDENHQLTLFEPDQPIINIQMNPCQCNFVFTCDNIHWAIFSMDSNQVIHQIEKKP